MKETISNRRIIITFVLLVAIALGLTLYFIDRFDRATQRIEENKMCLFATGMTYSIVNVYVEQHGGQWPVAWEDLDGLSDPERPYNGTFDSEFCREWVSIDFSIEATDILNSTPQSFTGIQPKCEIPEGTLDHLHGELAETIRRLPSCGPVGPEPIR